MYKRGEDTLEVFIMCPKCGGEIQFFGSPEDHKCPHCNHIIKIK